MKAGSGFGNIYFDDQTELTRVKLRESSSGKIVGDGCFAAAANILRRDESR
jgi:hypothetical protein